MPQSRMERFSPSTLSQLEPTIHGIIKKVLGFSEPSLLQTAINTVQQGGLEKDIASMIYY